MRADYWKQRFSIGRGIIIMEDAGERMLAQFRSEGRQKLSHDLWEKRLS